MDVRYFLRRRTSFIRKYYDEGRKPFDAIKLLIEESEPPYEPPSFNPDFDADEPPFLEEWSDAETAIQLHGRACVTLLSDALKLYFQSLERELRFKPTDELKRQVFKRRGFVAGYKCALTEVLDTDWSDCPANFAVLEQVALTRNRAQHGSHLFGFYLAHDASTLKKFTSPLFVSEAERALLAEQEADRQAWQRPSIEVDRETLFEAIREVELLADWIEERGASPKWW